jgi:hypothetical protein
MAAGTTEMAIWSRLARSIAGLSAVALAAACSSESAKPKPKLEPAVQPLVTFERWTSVARSEDPFVDDPAAAPACVGSGFRVEPDDEWVEIDTGLCNWVTLTQPARFAVAQGDEIRIGFSHFDLDAAAPSQAELRLRFEDCEAWSKTIPIPSAAAVFVEPFYSPCALEAGQSVLFHLHNHGQNTYQLSDLSLLR